MVFLLDFMLFSVGLVVLLVASELTVFIADRLAHLIRLSTAAVGLIILSFGTSIPEFAVSIFAALDGEQLITMGTLVGSNVTNLTLVLGIAGLFGVVAFTRQDLRMSLTVILTSVIGFIALVSASIGPAFGLFALVIYFFFIFVIIRERYAPRHLDRRPPRDVTAKALVTLFASIGLVLLSAKIVTDMAVAFAGQLGVNLSIIGMMLAFGTSLPEVSVAVAAVWARRSSLAIGTLVGSSLSNIGLILGLTLFLSPITIGVVERFLFSGMLVVNALYVVLSSRRSMGRTEAGLLIIIYGAFVALLAGVGI